MRDGLLCHPISGPTLLTVVVVGGGGRFSVYVGEGGTTLPSYFGGLLCLLEWRGEATLSTGVRGAYSSPYFGGVLCLLGGGGGGGEATGVKGAYSPEIGGQSRPPSPP